LTFKVSLHKSIKLAGDGISSLATATTAPHLDSIHDFGELELKSDLQKPLVLADGIRNARLNTVSV
jgi:hypothetical protein